MYPVVTPFNSKTFFEKTLDFEMDKHITTGHSYGGLDLKGCIKVEKLWKAYNCAYGDYWRFRIQKNWNVYFQARIAYFQFIDKCPVCGKKVGKTICCLY